MEHLDLSGLKVLDHYNQYANQLVLRTAQQLDDAAFTGSASPSHGSVQGLLTHMLTVEFFFLARCEGKPVNPKEIPDKSLSIHEIQVTFAQIAEERRRYLEWIKQEMLDELVIIPINGKEFTLPRWQFLTQSLIHSAHHRGELSIVMTALGQPLPTLDPILQFVNESGQEWF